MATNSVGIGKEVISASVPSELAAEIKARAQLLRWSKSKYAAELLINWYERGCPSVTPLEESAQYEELKVAEEQAPYKSQADAKPPSGSSGSTPPVPSRRHSA